MSGLPRPPFLRSLMLAGQPLRHTPASIHWHRGVMETLRVPSIPPELGVRASKAAPVIVATDGRRQSDAAIIVGKMLAGDPEALKVVSVIRPMPIIPDTTLR